MSLDPKTFLELVKKRRSCRDYSGAPVPDELIGNCLEAARLAPSACNKQPWRFIIVKDCGLRSRICSEGLLPGIPMPWTQKAPAIVVLCAETSIITHTIAPMISKVQYHLIDIGIAGEHFVLAAEAQGLGTCWIGWFNEKKIRKILNLPRSFQVLSLITLGYPANPDKQGNDINRMKLKDIARTIGHPISSQEIQL
ncbi:MAG: nitroreductase family protein [Victivallales bacterium]